MGLFLQTAVIPDCKEIQVREALQKIAENLSEEDMIADLKPQECQYKTYCGGTAVLLNEDCVGYDELAKELSAETGTAVLVLYIYDEDYWGYYLYHNGIEKDAFQTLPDYFKALSEKEKQKVKGNAKIISDYFHVEEASIKEYLVFWTEEMFESEEEEKAYEEDEFGRGNCWQMADFMQKLGFPYEWE